MSYFITIYIEQYKSEGVANRQCIGVEFEEQSHK